MVLVLVTGQRQTYLVGENRDVATLSRQEDAQQKRAQTEKEGRGIEPNGD